MANNKEVTASYNPLYETLKERNLTMSDLVQRGILSPTEVLRMSNGFALSQAIAALCDYLNCSEEDIVEYIPIPKE
ncbi:MAG: helix-turn-helix transcriptional regulator [Eggerthellaceae bacterium]|nr:helix-turn-helix transcriptional regulator [Eggerthellaceae bacterium]